MSNNSMNLSGIEECGQSVVNSVDFDRAGFAESSFRSPLTPAREDRN